MNPKGGEAEPARLQPLRAAERYSTQAEIVILRPIEQALGLARFDSEKETLK